jgi:predicted transcriptional regulator
MKDTITCKKCGKKVKNVFGAKLTHVLTSHQDVLIEEMVNNGTEGIREKATKLGRELRERFTHARLD